MNNNSLWFVSLDRLFARPSIQKDRLVNEKLSGLSFSSIYEKNYENKDFLRPFPETELF
jgi:hypothetical protein